METLSAKVIGELVAANERAVSIVPADIAEELVRIAGVGIVRHRFGWTLPPITLFERKAGGQYFAVVATSKLIRLGLSKAAQSVWTWNVTLFR